MKTKSLLAALLLTVAGLQIAWAQQSMKVWRNGEYVLYNVNDVDSVSFVNLVTQISLSKSELAMEVGNEEVLMATVEPDDADERTVTWRSSDISIATVDQTGKVTAKAAGFCTITVKATDGSGVKATCDVTVTGGVPGPIDVTNPLDGHAWVDLGLPSGTLWATCNIGAEKPGYYGYYYAWGETEFESKYDEDEDEYIYSWGTYKYSDASGTTMTKYNEADGKTELEPVDDAASVNWSGNWQTPSSEQFEELVNESYTTAEWTTQNGKKGYLITSKSNGNSVFLPAAGLCMTYGVTSAGSTGLYMSRSLDSGKDRTMAYELIIASVLKQVSTGYRYVGMSVRPVVKGTSTSEPISGLVSKIKLSDATLSLQIGDRKTLTATVLPENAENKEVTWESSNTSVATIDNSGLVVAKANGVCVITCRATDGSGVKAECRVTVGDYHEYVDLDLPSGTLWATCNIGASAPEEYGDPIAWGETEAKEEYTWETYKYCNGTDSSITKYCTKSEYGYNGFTDGKTMLEPTDDAATVNWGAEWQMPSQEQFLELINEEYTTNTWTTRNGVKGLKITSDSNGKSIFLPAACFGGETFNIDIEGNPTYTVPYGIYWTNQLDAEGYSSHAILLGVLLEGVVIAEGCYARYDRCAGFSIRPVKKK